jgi:DNA processing protein
MAIPINSARRRHFLPLPEGVWVPVPYFYGRQVTERIVTELAKGQVTIVSGLALGIDTIAHTAALDAGGRTIAILASGLDIIYPPTNRGLARRIVESGQGALITEYPLGVNDPTYEDGGFPPDFRWSRCPV